MRSLALKSFVTLVVSRDSYSKIVILSVFQNVLFCKWNGIFCYKVPLSWHRCHLCVQENKSHLLLKCPGTQRWREELLNSKWSHIKEETALREILNVKTATEQRNLSILAYIIKCKCENRAKKVELKLGRVGFARMRLYVGLGECKQQGQDKSLSNHNKLYR